MLARVIDSCAVRRYAQEQMAVHIVAGVSGRQHGTSRSKRPQDTATKDSPARVCSFVSSRFLLVSARATTSARSSAVVPRTRFPVFTNINRNRLYRWRRHPPNPTHSTLSLLTYYSKYGRHTPRRPYRSHRGARSSEREPHTAKEACEAGHRSHRGHCSKNITAYDKDESDTFEKGRH